jgi:hypothetical protein
MSDFIHYDLKQQKRGAVVEVTLNTQANVQLLDSSSFTAYRNGRQYRYIGGLATKSPIRLAIPRNGHWHVVIDLGGYSGSVRSDVRVLPGALPTIRSQSVHNLDAIAAAALEADPTPADDRKFDVFISHATEDKDAVVRPLAHALDAEGLDVWYDEFELRLGDSLRRKIDYGLANSRFGVVVVSRSFFAKNWAQYELDGLVTREMAGGEQVILPIWHEISKDEIIRNSPSLADKLALRSSDETIDEMAAEIAEVVRSH